MDKKNEKNEDQYDHGDKDEKIGILLKKDPTEEEKKLVIDWMEEFIKREYESKEKNGHYSGFLEYVEAILPQLKDGNWESDLKYFRHVVNDKRYQRNTAHAHYKEILTMLEKAYDFKQEIIRRLIKIEQTKILDDFIAKHKL